MDTSAPSVILAFVAGLLSFLSPCVLPMVLVYVGYISGHAIVTPDQQRASAERFATFLHALAFVIGFSLVFIALGVAVGGLARLLRSDWVRWIGGLLMIFFGLALTGAIKMPFLYTERRITMRARPGWGYLSSWLIGISFAAGWTPCIGPVLGSILALGAVQQTTAQAALLLAFYSVGLGLPFLLVGLAADRARALIRRIQRYLHPAQVATGILLILFGVLLFMDWLRVLGTWMTQLGIGWDVAL